MAPGYVKGGVWSNVEDQILKAAVSKYGLTQWSRVASLLTRKSAKQAKARWDEWLNPQLNKSGWSKDEDEKLLNLVKQLPNQWRTISQVLGRVASDCHERFEKLLEGAEGDYENEEWKPTGPGIETLPAAGEREQTGSFIANPEQQPATGLGEDIVDEEKEMLSEARARLANTQGKKAKRKARERMLEESKRVAMLQKRREMKAAGMNAGLESKNSRKRKQFDYINDIPHERAPEAGPYDVSEEIQRNDLERTDFDKAVSARGLEVADKEKPDRKIKQKPDKGRKKVFEKENFEAGTSNEYAEDSFKKRKLELPSPENEESSFREDGLVPISLSTQPLMGLFASEKDDHDHATDDIEQRILATSRDLKAKQSVKSSLIDHDPGVASSGISEKQREFIPSEKKIAKMIVSLFGALPHPVQTELESKPLPLPKFDEELQKQINAKEYSGSSRPEASFPSFPIRHGMRVPHPSSLKIPDYSKLSPTEKLIYDELKALIASDYTKFENNEYRAPLVENLSEEKARAVEEEVSRELANVSPRTTESDVYSLPRSTSIYKELLSLYESLTKLLNELVSRNESNGHYHDYESKCRQLRTEINETYHEKCSAAIKLSCYGRVVEEEQANMNFRIDYLNTLVDDLVQSESKVQEEINSLSCV